MISSVQRSLVAAATALVLALPGAAWSAVSFSGSFGLSGAAFSDPGLVIDTEPSGGDLAFSLEEGETFETALFDIWTDETSVQDDDVAPQALRVRFDFQAQGGSVEGESAGARAFRGLIQYGQVVWSNPLVLTFGATRLSVTLADAVFNEGFLGLDEGAGAGATIMARFTLLPAAPSPSPVPLPASISLLAAGLGAGGLTLALRRRVRDGALRSS